MTKDELTKMYHKNRKDIAKLYNGYTPVKEIKELNRINEIAYQNELKKLES
jgi:hypothetical protein